MRRVGILSRPARKARALLGAALALAVVGSLAPAAAFADEQVPEDPAVVSEQSAAATEEEVPEDPATVSEQSAAATEEEAAEDPAVVTEQDAVSTEEGAGEDAPIVTEQSAVSADEVAAIPTPDGGDYVGSNTADELDPGAFTSQLTSLSATAATAFNAGNIISDSKMFTSGTMTASQIQYFFDKKVPRCDSGYTCLKDFKMTTVSKSPNSYCSGSYSGARNESAAQIISKVSKACGVSEKVLIVMLQKEQGLVTHVWPSQFRYDIAMGYACPDDAACNSQYFGFQNQMYMAAYQLQRYTKDKYFNWYPVGKTSPVRYHPNIACGAGLVKIENKATAALYYYTPYQPNRAALRAGYGVGDSCSAYGNRNFVNYYTEWFGSTHGNEKPAAPSQPSKPAPSAGEQAITAKWKALGGASGVYGRATGSVKCNLAGGGCYQSFQGGGIYWKKSTGAQAVSQNILDGWWKLDKEKGALGFPNGSRRCVLVDGGCYQSFEGGMVYVTPHNGSVPVTSAMVTGWSEQNREKGALGYPTRTMVCGLASGGCYQQFDHGATYWTSSTGAHATTSRTLGGWRAVDKEKGKLGYPTKAMKCGLPSDGCYQQFQGGKVYWSKNSGSHPIYGSIMNQYQALGNEHSRLGYPTSGENCRYSGGACRQSFQHGYIQWTPGRGTIYRYN